MTQLSASDRKIIQSLLAAAKKRSAAAGPQGDVREYDFTVPNQFPPSGLERLREFGRAMAGRIAQVLTKVLQEPFEVDLAGVDQAFGASLNGMAGNDPHYWIALSEQQGAGAGVFGLRPERAMVWVSRLLGGSEEEIEDVHELSALEAELLGDVVDTLCEGLSDVCRQWGVGGVQRQGTLSKEQFPLTDNEAEAYLRLLFRKAGDQGAPGGMLALPVGMVEPVAGIEPVQQSADADEHNRQRMLEHLSQVAVPCRIMIGGAELSMRDIVSLEPGDVLLLEPANAQPAEMIVEGKRAFSGVPAQYENHYALQVLQRDFE